MKDVKKVHIAIVRSLFHKAITDRLEKSCIATLQEEGIAKKNITVIHVPGSWEIPLAAQKLAKRKRYDAIIAFGVIRKGDTHHFELIANECARGCMDVMLTYDVPVIFEVLAVYNIEDAIKRVTRKGVEAGRSALAMIEIIQNL